LVYAAVPFFFWKVGSSNGMSCTRLGIHADQTQCRPGYSSSLRTCHTEALTPHARTPPTRTP
jgi:hypothetical protein